MQISGEVNDIILKGYELAKGNKDEFVTAEHLSMEHLISAIYDLENSYASYYLQEEGIEKRDLLYKLCHEENEDDEYMEEGLIS